MQGEEHSSKTGPHLFHLSLVSCLIAVLVALAWQNAAVKKQLATLTEKPIREVYNDWRSGGSNNTDTPTERVGIEMFKQGYRAKYPVIMIPGFVTSGLEYWKGHECAAGTAS